MLCHGVFGDHIHSQIFFHKKSVNVESCCISPTLWWNALRLTAGGDKDPCELTSCCCAASVLFILQCYHTLTVTLMIVFFWNGNLGFVLLIVWSQSLTCQLKKEKSNHNFTLELCRFSWEKIRDNFDLFWLLMQTQAVRSLEIVPCL